MSNWEKRQMKSKQEFRDMGFKNRDRGLERRGDVIYDLEFDSIVELKPQISGTWDYFDKDGVLYRKEWLKESKGL
jgi:hypothetical protein